MRPRNFSRNKARKASGHIHLVKPHIVRVTCSSFAGQKDPLQIDRDSISFSNDPITPTVQREHQSVSCYGCCGPSSIICEFSEPEVCQFLLFTYLLCEKCASSIKKKKLVRKSVILVCMYGVVYSLLQLLLELDFTWM